MILISSEGDRFEVEDEYATHSPFLEGILEATESREATLDRVNTRSLEAYISFLEGQVPKMDTEIEEAFDFMGHPNVLQYPSDYWAIKLHDVWVRDNMYRLNLLDDPFYDLVEIPIRAKNYINPLPKGIYAAGGYALYLSGYAKQAKVPSRYTKECQYPFSDVDLFTISEEAVEEFLLSLEHRVRVGDHTVDFPIQCLEAKGSYLIHRPCYKGQIILRLYKAPTEIVHGFDLDCCGFLLSYDDGTPRLWATKRALWSAQNTINWFDPDRMSPSYAYRMAKYMTRGFKPMLPLLHDLVKQVEEKYNDRVQTIFDRIKRKFEKALVGYEMDYDHDDLRTTTIQNPEVTILRILDILRRQKVEPTIRHLTHMLLVFDMFRDSDMDSPGTQMGALMRVHTNVRNDTEGLVPQDPASIVILAALEGFYTSSWTGYDYEEDIAHDYEKVSKKMLRKLSWKTLYPMAQLSGTFHPDPINDLKAWYLTSPLLEGASTSAPSSPRRNPYIVSAPSLEESDEDSDL